jgi:hypothetical protein
MAATWAHLTAAHPEQPLRVCEVCGENFDGARVFNRHMAEEHPSCRMCGKVCTGERDFARHTLRVHAFACVNRGCADFGVSFGAADGLAEHVRSKHKHACEACSKMLAGAREYQRHIRRLHKDVVAAAKAAKAAAPAAAAASAATALAGIAAAAAEELGAELSGS